MFIYQQFFVTKEGKIYLFRPPKINHMKKLILSLVIIVFVVESCSQSTTTDTPSLYPPTYLTKQNIVLVGIKHSDSTLLDGPSKEIFCSAFPRLLEASAGKPIIFLMEGIPNTVSGYFDPSVSRILGLPECIAERYPFIGCDNRSGIFQPEFMDAFHTILNFAYDDGINGQEKSLEESFKKPSSLRLDRLDSVDKEDAEFWGKRMAKDYKEFEDSILSSAQNFEKKGYYVVVFCGAAHAVKISMQESTGYLLCTKDSLDILQSIKSAKILSLLEKKE